MPLLDPVTWPDDDFVWVTHGLDPMVLLQAYRTGAFPMPLRGPVVGWWSPMRRGVLPLDGLKVSRSLRKTAKRYRVTVDVAFEQVLAGCADPRREHGWIDRQIASTYTFLHEQGIVHSVETWDADDRLAGGLYGVAIGGLFCGESMFHDPELGRDASKVALMGLVRHLGSLGTEGRLLDVQWQTPHLASLGVVEVPRAAYLERLPTALEQPAVPWVAGEVPHLPHAGDA